jgi:hypothetical protein
VSRQNWKRAHDTRAMARRPEPGGMSAEELRRRLRDLARETNSDVGDVWALSDEEKLDLIGYLIDVKRGVR